MHKKWWFAAIGLSLVFIFLIAAALYSEHQEYRPNENELVNHEEIASHLSELGVDMDTAPTSKIGVLVDSFQFQSSNDVQVTGYIWQTYDNTVISDDQVGIIFPESVGGTSFEERYHEVDGNMETVGWYFETVLRQNFDYSKYPIDHKTIWIRMLSNSFVSDMVFLPDLDSYPSTGYEDTFGVDETIVLTGWQLTETFFDYHEQDYNTSFGMSDKNCRNSYPELEFNIVIERNFMQAMFVNLAMILVIMILLYSLVLMITSEKDKLLDLFGMSASGAIGTCSALFFSVLIAHIDLRSMFGGQLVYMEMYYYLAYLFILVTSVLVFVFMKEVQNDKHPVVSSNAIVFKLLYWPVFLGLILVVTYIWL